MPTELMCMTQSSLPPNLCFWGAVQLLKIFLKARASCICIENLNMKIECNHIYESCCKTSYRALMPKPSRNTHSTNVNKSLPEKPYFTTNMNLHLDSNSLFFISFFFNCVKLLRRVEITFYS